MATTKLKLFKALYPDYAAFNTNVITPLKALGNKANNGANTLPPFMDDSQTHFTLEMLFIFLSNKYDEFMAVNTDDRQHKLMTNAFYHLLPSLYIKTQALSTEALNLISDPVKLLSSIEKRYNENPDTKYASTETAYSSSPDATQAAGTFTLNKTKEKNIINRKDATVKIREMTNLLGKLAELNNAELSGFVIDFINSIEISSLWEYVGEDTEIRVEGLLGPLLIKGTVANIAALPSDKNVGDAYWITADNSLSTWNGSIWLNSGSLKGATGATGNTGPQGPAGPAYDDTNLQNQITVNANNHQALQDVIDAVKGSATGSGQKKDLDEFDGTTDDKTLASEKFVLDHSSGNFKDMSTYSFAGKTKNDIYNDFLNDPNGTIYIFGNIEITIGTSEALSFIRPTPTTYSGAVGWKQQSEHGADFQLTIFSAGDMWNVSADQNDPSHEIFNVGKATRNQALITNSDRMITEIHIAGVNSFEGSFSTGQKLDQFAGITTTVSNYAFVNERNLKSLNMPRVQTIGESAFEHSPLTSLSLPLATSIGESAFEQSQLTSLSLPLATSIGDYAFNNVSSLTSLSLPLATSIGNSAFYYCRLTSLNLPLATSIGGSAFYYIVNSSSTTARLNVKFNTNAEKDRIFGRGHWNNIQFTWTNNQGQDINPQPAPTPQPAPPVPVEQRIADLEAKIAILTNEVENK